jgi:uncharacterized protein with FMN-binding domain
MDKRIIPIVGLAIIVIAASGVVGWQKIGSRPPETKTETQAKEPMFKDGEYQSTGVYTSPAGPEKIEVKLTIKDGIVAAAEVAPAAVHEGSKFFQNKFIGGYQPLVIGRKISDLALDKVSGSSLTPKGFNDAVTKIRQQAQT